MISILYSALIAWLFIEGLYIISQRGMIFSFFGNFADRLGHTIAKPLARCTPCMASFWGSLIHWAMFAYSPMEFLAWLAAWPLVVFCVAGLASVTISLTHDE